MATTTPRFGLRKPATTDTVDVGLDLNGNWDIVDAQMIGQSVVDAKGDLLVATGPDTIARYPVGADGLVLKANAAAPAGVEWAAESIQPDPAVVTLVDGATVPLDASAGKVFRLTAAGDRTIQTPSNPVDGRGMIIAHTASGGARTLTLTTGSAGSFAFGADITALSATASGLTDYIGAIYDGVSQRWRVVSYSKGYG
jgi:hypothetical protein